MSNSADQQALDDVDAVLRSIAMTGEHQPGLRVLRRALEYWQRSAALAGEFAGEAPPAPPEPVVPAEPDLAPDEVRCRHHDPVEGRCTRLRGHVREGKPRHRYFNAAVPVTTTRAPARFSEGLTQVG